MMSISFEEKEQLAADTVNAALSMAKNPCVCFSGGKKAVVAMHLARRALGKCPTAIYISTGLEMDATVAFIAKMGKLWQFKVITVKPIAALANPGNQKECCKRMIGDKLCDAVKMHGFDLIITGCTGEDDRMYLECDHSSGMIIQRPIYEFKTTDVWSYIKKYNLPKCSLYDQGFEKVDCKPCMSASAIQDNGKAAAEEEHIRDKLRKLGYL